MKIVADENLAFTDYFFAEFGEIHCKAGRSLTQADVKHAQALLVRSVTQVNAALLQDTALEFVGSATIGTDHLDLTALADQQITWANAAGCNAQAVAEYVVTALLELSPELLHANAEFTLGIVGLGNVGTRLAQMANQLGWQVIAYDPFVQHASIQQVDFTTLLAQADAISIHVPLTQDCPHATHHLFNGAALAQMKAEAILINSARGSVVEEEALIEDIRHTQRRVVLDVFEHEPKIDAALLNLLALATPHIAGYSLEGKARGTQMIYEAFCEKFGFSNTKQFSSQLPECAAWFAQADVKTVLAEKLKQIYPIAEDDRRLRACLKDGQIEQQAFDHLRKTYPLRREWAAYGGPEACL